MRAINGSSFTSILTSCSYLKKKSVKSLNKKSSESQDFKMQSTFQYAPEGSNKVPTLYNYNLGTYTDSETP